MPLSSPAPLSPTLAVIASVVLAACCTLSACDAQRSGTSQAEDPGLAPPDAGDVQEAEDGPPDPGSEDPAGGPEDAQSDESDASTLGDAQEQDPGPDAGEGDAEDGPNDAVTDSTDAADTEGTDEGDMDAQDDAQPDDTAQGDADHEAPLTAARCLSGQWPSPTEALVDYDRFGPTLGTHCMGTRHQSFEGVQRVIFVGDSLTVGSPPTAAGDWYRNVLAERLARHYALRAPNFLWQQADVVNGRSLSQESGDFACCAKWGARADDITRPPHRQMQTCAGGADKRALRTLFIMTVGGNDIFKWAQDLADGASIETIWPKAEEVVRDMEESLRWATDPANFPNGSYVVFASTFDFTDVDSARDFSQCPGAGIISMDSALVDPAFHEVVRWVMEQYMRIAVETGSDLAFVGERWCGHGHNGDNPQSRCYRGPNTPNWHDITCMHPNAAGHRGIADTFFTVITSP